MNFNYTANKTYNNYQVEAQLRKSTQLLMPVKLDYGFGVETVYNIYPVYAPGENEIFNGYASLAAWIIKQKTVVIH